MALAMCLPAYGKTRGIKRCVTQGVPTGPGVSADRTKWRSHHRPLKRRLWYCGSSSVPYGIRSRWAAVLKHGASPTAEVVAFTPLGAAEAPGVRVDSQAIGIEGLMRTALPQHIGFIPDGNRRWAQDKGLAREHGYGFGIEPGVRLFEHCRDIGVKEMSIYGFTRDNTKRPAAQKEAFSEACVRFADDIKGRGAALLVLGDEDSGLFPKELRVYRERQGAGMKVNLLVNYGWDWDIEGLHHGGLRSGAVSRIDLIVRWGGGRRLSGFLPIQSVYADFFVVDEYWPDFTMDQFEAALRWFRAQDRTLGG